jgi:hypothetical protein
VPCADLKAYLDPPPTEVGMLLPSPRGGMWDPRNFSKRFRNHLDSIGLVDRHFHGLRDSPR